MPKWEACSGSDPGVGGGRGRSPYHFPSSGRVAQHIFQPLELLARVSRAGRLLIVAVVQIGVEDHNSPSPPRPWQHLSIECT